MSLSRALATLSPLGLVRSGVFSLAPPTTSPSRGGYGRHSNLTPFILYTSDWSLTGPRRRQLSRATFKNLDALAADRRVARACPPRAISFIWRVPFARCETRFYWCY